MANDLSIGFLDDAPGSMERIGKIIMQEGFKEIKPDPKGSIIDEAEIRKAEERGREFKKRYNL